MCFNPKFAYYGYVFETPKGLKGIENARLTKKLHFTKKTEGEINTLRKDVLVIPCGKCLACRRTNKPRKQLGNTLLLRIEKMET